MTQWNSDGHLLEALGDVPIANRPSMLTKFIIGRIAALLETGEGEAIAPDSRFEQLGVDSRYALEFKEYLEQELRCALRTTLMFDYPTPAGLAAHLLDIAFAPENESEPRPAPSALADAGAGSTPVEELMMQKLRQYNI